MMEGNDRVNPLNLGVSQPILLREFSDSLNLSETQSLSLRLSERSQFCVLLCQQERGMCVQIYSAPVGMGFQLGSSYYLTPTMPGTAVQESASLEKLYAFCKFVS